jgi:uncharacterized metal-binding protein YceD (DUF177 family)
MTKQELLQKKQEQREQAIKNSILIRAKTRQELRAERAKQVPQAQYCESSYTQQHMYVVHELEKGKFVAICTRCLKQTLVSV